MWSWPLLIALWFTGQQDGSRKQRIKRGFWLGYLCGFVFFAMNTHWIFHTGKVVGMWIAGVGAVVGMGLYLGLYFGLFGIFSATAGRLQLPPVTQWQSKGESSLLDPKFISDLFGHSWTVIRVAFLNGACWCGLEWLRSVAFTGYSWNTLGVALVERLMLVQFADTIGQLGYGFIIMFCGVVGLATVFRFAKEIRHHQAMRPHLDFAAAIAIVIGIFLYGFDKVVERPEETVDLKVRLIQMRTSINDKYSSDQAVLRGIIDDYRESTRLWVDHGDYDLVMWPETAIPAVFSRQDTADYFNNDILKGDDFYLLTGIEENDINGGIYNTITLMKGHTDSHQMYTKMHLVPFGEYVPGRDWPIPIFDWIFGKVIGYDFTPGTSYDNLYIEKAGQKIGLMPLICFEDTVARHARKFVLEGQPQFLANVTNDAWFYDSAARDQHFANARFRCIELRRPMVRAANTGVSGFVDETGNIYDRDSPETEPRRRIIEDLVTGDTYIEGSTVETLKVDLSPPTSVYSRIGDAFSITMAAIALAVWLGWFFLISRIKSDESLK